MSVGGHGVSVGIEITNRRLSRMNRDDRLSLD